MLDELITQCLRARDEAFNGLYVKLVNAGLPVPAPEDVPKLVVCKFRQLKGKIQWGFYYHKDHRIELNILSIFCGGGFNTIYHEVAHHFQRTIDRSKVLGRTSDHHGELFKLIYHMSGADRFPRESLELYLSKKSIIQPIVASLPRVIYDERSDQTAGR